MAQKILVVSAQHPDLLEDGVNKKLMACGKGWNVVSASTAVSSVLRNQNSSDTVFCYVLTAVVEKKDVPPLTLEQLLYDIEVVVVLKNRGISSVEELVSYTERELTTICRFLEFQMEHIKTQLAARHLCFKMDPYAVACSELNLPKRTLKILVQAGIDTIGQLCEHTYYELASLRFFGWPALKEVREKLAAIGLKLTGD